MEQKGYFIRNLFQSYLAPTQEQRETTPRKKSTHNNSAIKEEMKF